MASIIRRIRTRPPTYRSTGFGAFFAISSSYAAVGCRGSTMPIIAGINNHARYLFNLRSNADLASPRLRPWAPQGYLGESPGVSHGTIRTSASTIGGAFLIVFRAVGAVYDQTPI